MCSSALLPLLPCIGLPSPSGRSEDRPALMEIEGAAEAPGKSTLPGVVHGDLADLVIRRALSMWVDSTARSAN